MRERIDSQYEDLDVSDPGTNVARGAALLDEKVPGWANTVQGSMLEGMFQMTDWEHCVVGALELNKVEDNDDMHGHLIIAFNGQAIAQFGEACYALGFDAPSGQQSEFDELEDAWRREIAERTGNLNVLDREPEQE